MPTLYGFDAVEREFLEYSRPIMLLGHKGSGRRTWIEQHTPQDSLVIKTTSRKQELEQVSKMITPGAAFTWVLHLDLAYNLNYISSLLRKVTSSIVVLIYSDVAVPEALLDLCFVHYSPYLTDDQMRQVCADKGLRQDEIEFAVSAANGVPGNIDKSFELLRSRKFILEFLENVRDNNYKALSAMCDSATQNDMNLLQSILTSFRTGRWSLFTEVEVEPLKRVTGLLEACLETYEYSSIPIAFSAISVGTLHAYHGRV